MHGNSYRSTTATIETDSYVIHVIGEFLALLNRAHMSAGGDDCEESPFAWRDRLFNFLRD